MCGFAGAVVWDERYRVAPATLQKMSAAVAHRGPDGEGFHHTRLDSPIDPANPQVALAFRRLAILDVGSRSNQPFTTGSKTLVFNGEIYNFRDLRQELTSLLPDWHWRTTGDTEVLLAAYTAWGEGCVDHLNGMFAFAVWDEAEKTLFLARDRMGQKPLYVAVLRPDGEPGEDLICAEPQGRPPAVVAFASELGALLPLPWWDRSVDESSMAAYLSLGYVVFGTIYRGVHQLNPSQWMKIDGSGYAAVPYCRFAGDGPDYTRAAQMTRGRVLEAVRRQMVSDVPIGSFLSGGVDSAVITAGMRATGAEVHTFSMGFDDPRYDETNYAAAVAKHLGTRHHRFCVRPDAAADLPKLAAVFGEPFGDSSALPTHYLARETRQHVKVALSGDGGDELFGGYDRYRALHLTEQLQRLPRSIRRTISQFSRWIPGTHPKARLTRIKRLASSLPQSAGARYAGYIRLFDHGLLARLFPAADEWANPTLDPLGNLFDSFVHQRDAVTRAVLFDRLNYLPHDLLTKVDRASMLHNLEVRSPFMDHELVTFAAGLTTDQLLKGGPKRMLREAFAADLPAWVFKRKKMGFAVPIGEWFRGPLRAMLRDTLFSAHAFGRGHFNMAVVQRLVDEHESGRVDHSQRLYALLMLELWWNTARA